jgi:glyoxylase-like metal-dependent hydrolase (beta-lactamase superfamily II)
LEQLGIKSDEISYIIISHFHADHIAGLKDFNRAKFICFKEAYQNIKNKKSFFALKEGYLPDLLPVNFEERLIYIENKVESNKFKPFDYYFDVFGDNSILAFDLSGHAKGQCGLLVEDKFFVADACWYSNSYKKNFLPPLWVRMLLGDNKEYLKTLNKYFICPFVINI